jgi:hypothetical protein
MKRHQGERQIKQLPCIAGYHRRHPGARAVYGEVALQVRIAAQTMRIVGARSGGGNVDDEFAACACEAWSWTGEAFHTYDPDEPDLWIRLKLKIDDIPRRFPTELREPWTAPRPWGLEVDGRPRCAPGWQRSPLCAPVALPDGADHGGDSSETLTYAELVSHHPVIPTALSARDGDDRRGLLAACRDLLRHLEVCTDPAASIPLVVGLRIRDHRVVVTDVRAQGRPAAIPSASECMFLTTGWPMRPVDASGEPDGELTVVLSMRCADFLRKT